MNRYLGFCRQHKVVSPFPLTESVLLQFVAFLSLEGLSYPSVRAYLSGLRFMQILSGLEDPAFSSFGRLEYVLRGVRRLSPSGQRPQRFPITPRILRLLHDVWSQQPVSHDTVMLWAACCVGFFGFLRAGEFTCPSLEAYSSTMLSARDVAVDSHSSPSFVTLHLRQSKTDVFGMGVTIYLARVEGPVCPVKALLPYLVLRGSSPGPLFRFQDGSTLSRARLVSAVCTALASHGLDVSRFNGHSFRIGAATTAAACGIEDSLIQTLGRWKSQAFTTYIRTPRDILLSVPSRLISSSIL